MQKGYTSLESSEHSHSSLIAENASIVVRVSDVPNITIVLILCTKLKFHQGTSHPSLRPIQDKGAQGTE